MIVFEGLDASGKGVQIGKLIQALDPRGFEVFAVKKETEEEKYYPYMKRFWTKIPEHGKVSILIQAGTVSLRRAFRKSNVCGRGGKSLSCDSVF